MKRMNFRRFTILLLASLLVLPLFSTPAKAAEIAATDMYYPVDMDDHWAYDALDNFINADLLRGYVDHEGTVTVKPNHSISRAEFVSILVRALGLTSDASGTAFTDVKQGKWYFEPIRIASSLGIVNGMSETTFGPNQLIKRGEIATMIVNAFSSSVSFEGTAKSFKDVPEYYAKQAIQKASQAGIVQGASATQFKPFANAKRAEAVVMLQRALDLQSSALPEDDQLKAVILNLEKTWNQAINDKAYDRFHDVDAQFYTGYGLANSKYHSDELIDLVKQGFEFKVEKVSEQKLTVTHKSDRFAVVESTGGSVKMTMTKDDSFSANTISSDGIYLLKKMSDNSWKIYVTFLEEEQEQEQ
ncbi:S-layer homology domain-containing protein [Paenibacillus sp. 481]|uniref:S-layer homology domain-containing protein n=1 Tax=Paenibacillus sp. 481 TaxID=2835869 RepID=UPI001E47F83D|nr:S-layer homology domain-containing protein [Paenibacillus sp. 481]UHA73531.1 S-layer homology domain-containing protein [Paenibacillus sp. 481]